MTGPRACSRQGCLVDEEWRITLKEQVRRAVGGVALPRKGRHDASARHRLRDAGDRGDGGGERAEEEEGGARFFREMLQLIPLKRSSRAKRKGCSPLGLHLLHPRKTRKKRDQNQGRGQNKTIPTIKILLFLRKSELSCMHSLQIMTSFGSGILHHLPKQ